jgi:spore coat polysaccharide biosynthesis predicted glycosyltransferase SpsG
MAVGTPFLAIAIADNQRRNLSWLAENGVGWPMGWHADIDDNAITTTIRIAMEDAEGRRHVAHRGYEMVDGKGVDRALERMKDSMLIASAR